MTSFFSQLFGWAMNRNEEEKEQSMTYLKSLLFLVLIVVLISNKYWDMIDNIKHLLGITIIEYIATLTQIGLHFFTALTMLAFVVLIISTVIYEIIKKVDIDSRWCGYFNRMRVGAEFRLSNSVEDVLLLFLVAWVFNNNIIIEYVNTYSELFFVVMSVACVLQFVFSTVKGVLNRFFILWISIS